MHAPHDASPPDAPDTAAPDTDAPETAEQLAYYGDPLKVLSTTRTADGAESVTLGGYLVRFSGPADPDLEGDFFTPETDFGTLTRRGATTLPAYYQHGFDPYFKNAAIGDAEVKLDEFGVWAEYQIELRSDYERHLVEMASKGKLGQSSGAVAHLVSRKRVGSAHKFTVWPLGEASLTPTPAEPRTSAVPLKMFQRWAAQQAPPALTIHPPETAMNEDTQAVEAVEAPAPAPAAEVKTDASPSRLISLDDARAIMAEEVKAMRESLRPSAPAEVNTKAIGAPALIKSGRGDTEAKAFKAWALGDDGAMRHAATGTNRVAIKASNDTDMNIGTAADGGNAVPTGHFNGIIARRDESRLDVGVRDIPGVGTTVNVPIDAEDDGEFVSTAEASANDRDAPALGSVAMTLVKYTKRVELSNELLADEESRLMSFIEDWIGRGMAKTHNDLLVTEVETNGSAIKTTTSTTALAAGELEDVPYASNIAFYLGDGGSGACWVMQPPTYGNIISITGNDRLYAEQVQGSTGGPSLFGYPVKFTQKAEAYGTTGNKFSLFGNFSYVGRREEPSFEVLRDPYSAASTGQLRLHYYFRTVYKVLQSEAVGYVDHA